MCFKFNKKIFPKIKFILGNNAVEPRGVKSNYFWADLELLKNKILQINLHSIAIREKLNNN